jgi:hypothetical protein
MTTNFNDFGYLLDLEEAKRHLRVLDSDSDDDIDAKLLQASWIVLNYLGYDGIPDDWLTDESPSTLGVPYVVRAAVLLVLSELYANRESTNANPLSMAVKSLLRRYRAPVIG